MAGILICDQIQNSSNTGQLTFDNSGNFTTGNLICSGTITGGTGLLNIGGGQIYKDTSGNVGIGTSSPGERLGVISALTGTTAGSNVVARFQTNGSGYDANISLGDNVNAAVRLGYLSGNMYFWTNGAERMRLDSSGNLGLGRTPLAGGTFATMQFKGGLIGSQNANYLYTAQNAFYDGSNWAYATTAAATLEEQSGGSYKWYTAPSGTAGNAISFTQAMTLDASGNLLVGTTSATAGAVTVRTHIAGNEFGLGISVPASGAQQNIRFVNGTTAVGSVTTTGSATAYNTSSDQRLKTNIAPASSAIQSILDFPVDQFDWIASGEHQDFGGVAQKIIPIIPEMVSVPEDPEQMMGVDWSKAVPRLIKAFQELSAKNTELENRLAALENK